MPTILLLGFLLGVAMGSFFHITVSTLLVILAVSGICFVYRYFYLPRSELRSTTGVEESSRRILLVVTVFLFALSIGVGRMMVSSLYEESKLTQFEGKKIIATGIIVGEPDVRESNTKLTVRVSEVLFANATTSVTERVLVTVPLYPEFEYGDKVSVSVTLKQPDNIESDDGRIFDYRGYLRVRGIWYTGSFAQIQLLEKGHGSLVKTGLFKIKRAFTNSLHAVLPEPEVSLLGGLLLGAKQSLGKELLFEFQKTGTSHVVVLSGYNIAIVATSIITLLKFLPKNFSFSIGIVSIILFTMLSGGGASATRAAIMVIAVLFAKRFNRDFKASRVLGVTIILMLAPNPLLLVFDPSFQLSVLATIGLIFVSPLVSPYLSRIPEKLGTYIPLREIISTTIATQITVLPFLIYNTGLVSLVSLPVNVLILGTIPVTMFLGFITGIVGLISFWFSFIPAFFTYILLWYQLTIVHLGAILPFGSVTLPVFSPIILVLVYVIIFTKLYFVSRNQNFLRQ